MKGALINSETILLRLQLFQYVNVPHQTKLTKCIVTIQNEKNSNLNTHTHTILLSCMKKLISCQSGVNVIYAL